MVDNWLLIDNTHTDTPSMYYYRYKSDQVNKKYH
jgi:hypothetical protein